MDTMDIYIYRHMYMDIPTHVHGYTDTCTWIYRHMYMDIPTRVHVPHNPRLRYRALGGGSTPWQDITLCVTHAETALGSSTTHTVLTQQCEHRGCVKPSCVSYLERN